MEAVTEWGCQNWYDLCTLSKFCDLIFHWINFLRRNSDTVPWNYVSFSDLFSL